MKKLLNFLLSMQFMGFLTLTLAFAMGFATFIENDFGAMAAREVVYNSWWFELLLLLFIINMTGSIIVNKTYRKKKFTIFLFHFSFILIFLGAAVTRYISYEGTMHIREGESSDIILSSDKYIYGTVDVNGVIDEYSFKANFIPGIKNTFEKTIKAGDKNLTIKLKEFIPSRNRRTPDIAIFTISDGSATKDISVPEKISRSQEALSSTIDDISITVSYGYKLIKLPFSLYLKDFKLERYPGSQSPSSYASEVILTDENEELEIPYRIYMNHTLKHKGFKFFQSSYDMDERGTILSVNHDDMGTILTYLGYLLMTIGMILSIFNKNSRFMKLARKTGVSGQNHKNTMAAILVVLVGITGITETVNAQEQIHKQIVIPEDAAKNFSSVLLQDQNGRIEPFYTMASNVLRKTYRGNKYKKLNPAQVVLGMYFFPEQWKYEPIILISGKIIPELLGITGKYASYADFFDNQYKYKLSSYVQKAYHKRPAERNMFDKDIIKVDERLNVCYLVYSGALLKLFPVENDHHWYTPNEIITKVSGEDSLFVSSVLPEWKNAVMSENKVKANNLLTSLKKYQISHGAGLIPSEKKIQLEIFYEKYDIFGKLTSLYGLIGFILVIILFSGLIKPNKKTGIAVRISTWLLLTGFIFHTAGLGIRWYISGHAPWSNGYESMIYIAWAAMLAGLIFVRNTPFALASAAILASLTLFVAHLSWMNPEITNLVPVLKSYWLTIHVSVITASYGFLGMGMIIGLINLVMYILKNEKNRDRIQQQIEILSNVNEMALILGVYFFSIGTFLGGVWANESWGRYWGWDPKETWSLVTGLVYVFVVHMRLIPGLRGYFAFNVASVLAFFSVIMTYFGVNYYLSGLHSYAQGDPVPIPAFVFYALGILIALIIFAWVKEKKLSKM
ncbi:MAG: c-type cytochrome biogenesis protein CcsB [Chlorobi bacterium]|nr:c-type cytochrome biogenesis protein CcsB [Chlorobiota bacterium]